MKLWIPEDRIAHNMLVAGASGTRKTSALMGLADQAIDRNWPVVFCDLKGSYLAEYYRPGIDVLINFADKRCVRWRLDREARNILEARAIAHGAVPEMPNDVPFFKQHTRNIFSFLVGEMRLRSSEIATLTAYPEELDKALKGTKYAALLSSDSGDIRGGILGNLGLIGDALSVLPDDDGRQEFCVREWGAMGPERKGNIFLCSSPTNFPAQRHLQSLLIDMLLLAVQTFHGPAMFILDEIGVFGKIPQLEPALSFQRSSGTPIVLAFQSFSQLRDNYGPEKAKSIVSNPYTKLILRMSAPEEAEYASKLLGLPSELERVRESRSAHWWTRHNHNYSTERPMISAVTGGEIQDLDDGRGYLGQNGCVTPVHLRYRAAQELQPRFVERTILPQKRMPSKEEPAKPYRSRYVQQKLIPTA